MAITNPQLLMSGKHLPVFVEGQLAEANGFAYRKDKYLRRKINRVWNGSMDLKGKFLEGVLDGEVHNTLLYRINWFKNPNHKHPYRVKYYGGSPEGALWIYRRNWDVEYVNIEVIRTKTDSLEYLTAINNGSHNLDNFRITSPEDPDHIGICAICANRYELSRIPIWTDIVPQPHPVPAKPIPYPLNRCNICGVMGGPCLSAWLKPFGGCAKLLDKTKLDCKGSDLGLLCEKCFGGGGCCAEMLIFDESKNSWRYKTDEEWEGCCPKCDAPSVGESVDDTSVDDTESLSDHSCPDIDPDPTDLSAEHLEQEAIEQQIQSSWEDVIEEHIPIPLPNPTNLI